MKRLIAVGMVAGFLLATSTAAFAVPTIATQSGSVVFDGTVTEGFTKVSLTDPSRYTWTWFQPFDAAAIPPADFSAYPPGGVLSGPDISITSAVLTIVASGVNPPPGPPTVWRGTSDTTWVAEIGSLSNSPGVFGTGDGTSVLPLTDADTWLTPTGFYVQVRAPGGDADVVVKSSNLSVLTDWSYTYTYDDGTVPAVPAPGAILLASMGAGLVSWLRARRSL